jgi:sugar/nucleoside kinase (ribokinase family)
MPHPTSVATSASTPVAIVAGHLCLDIIPTIDTPLSQGAALLSPGKLTHIGPAALATGGAVSNTGLALHRFGITTRLMGKIGDDLFGRAILDIVGQRDPTLAEGMIIDPNSPSSYTIVISAPGLDRSFLHCSGANDTFSAADVDDKRLAGASLFHFGYPPIMRRMFDNGGQELVALFQRVQAAAITTSLDMAHVDVDAPAGLVDWRALLGRVLPHVDFFLPSLDEIFFMLDPERLRRVEVSADKLHPAVYGGLALLRELADTLLEMGAAIVGLKLGDQGIYLRTTDDPARLARVGKLALSPAWLNRELLAPTFQVSVVGTTGAGDCAVAGFLAAVLRGLDPEAALTAAVGAGACNVEVADAVSGIPTWEALHARIERGWLRHPLSIPLPSWQLDEENGLWYEPYRNNL